MCCGARWALPRRHGVCFAGFQDLHWALGFTDVEFGVFIFGFVVYAMFHSPPC